MIISSLYIFDLDNNTMEKFVRNLFNKTKDLRYLSLLSCYFMNLRNLGKYCIIAHFTISRLEALHDHYCRSGYLGSTLLVCRAVTRRHIELEICKCVPTNTLLHLTTLNYLALLRVGVKYIEMYLSTSTSTLLIFKYKYKCKSFFHQST